MEYHAELVRRVLRVVAEVPSGRSRVACLCEAARDLLGADGAAIAIGNFAPIQATLCATGEVASDLEDLQDVLGEGPGQDALVAGQPVKTALGPDAEARWPLFAPAAQQILGGPAVLCSLPMRVGGDVIGTLSVFRLAASLDEPVDGAQVVAEAVATILLSDSAITVEAIRSSRPVVHQAVGIVMEQLAVDAEAAVAVLRSHAFATAAQLDEVAAAVVQRTLNLSPLWPP